MGIKAILIVIAMILFILEALHLTAKVSLGWIGMAVFAASFLV